MFLYLNQQNEDYIYQFFKKCVGLNPIKNVINHFKERIPDLLYKFNFWGENWEFKYPLDIIAIDQKPNTPILLDVSRYYKQFHKSFGNYIKSVYIFVWNENRRNAILSLKFYISHDISNVKIDRLLASEKCFYLSDWRGDPYRISISY